jgi:N-acetylneuraminic acid mutarotase
MRRVFLFILFACLIFGSFSGVFSAVLAVDLIDNSWNAVAPMSQARDYLGVVAFNGMVYAIGGRQPLQIGPLVYTDKPIDVNERYDPVSDTWVTLKAMPTPRSDFAIVAYQGKIYCIGGRTSDEWGRDVVCSVNEVYDIATNSWSTKKSLPVNGGSMHAQVVDGKIYVLNSTLMYMYDSVADSWIQKTGAACSEREIATAVVDDKLLLTSNIYESSTSVNSGWNGILSYDPKTDVWSEKQASGGGSVAAGVTTGVYAPKKVYFISRYGYNRIYDPVSNTWSTGETMVKSGVTLTGFGVAVVDDILYVIGGHNGYDSMYPGEPTNKNMQYTPSGHSKAIPDKPPVITILSPTNQTYYDSNVDLTFTVNKAVVKMYGCLDNKENVTITGNTTLQRVATGTHTITVYAEDKQGNIAASQTVTFTITTTNNPNPTNPTIVYNPTNPLTFGLTTAVICLIVATVSLIIVIGIILFITFHKKSKTIGDLPPVSF